MMLLFAFAAMFCSCRTYQYITVSSPDIKQNDQRQFVAENDTMKLTYNFSGNSGPLELTVFNKWDKPLLVDLNRSALIINDKAVSFYTGRVELSGTVSGNSFGWGNGVRTSSGTIDATATLPAGVIFIPAGAYITKTPLYITDKALENIPDEKFHKVKYTADDLTEYQLKTADFTREESPMVFKTYLTFYQADMGKGEMVQQHTFYVSEVCQAPAGASASMANGNGDRFCISEQKPGSGAAGAVVVAAALVAAAALQAKK